MSISKDYVVYRTWDSNFFGYKIGQIESFSSDNLLSETLERSRQAGYKLLYIKTDSCNQDLHQSLLQNRGRLVDKKITYRFFLSSNFEIDSENIKLNNTDQLSPALLNIVLQTGIYSRFYTDPGFDYAQYKELYTQWIKQSLNKELADEVILFVDDGNILGFLTLKVEFEIGKIVLIGVDSKQHRRGIGKQMMMKASNLSIERSCSNLEVVTQQDNIPACQFYKNFGFHIYKEEFIYHFWL
jgi:dTDP-4-amino-4,6-dideoxy-D-galactose acyltransferase